MKQHKSLTRRSRLALERESIRILSSGDLGCVAAGYVVEDVPKTDTCSQKTPPCAQTFA